MAGETATTTFLLTDIEGSTRLYALLRSQYDDMLRAHHELLRRAFAAHGGEELGTEGDSFAVAFPSASRAIAAAVDAQRALATHDWPQRAPVRVRMGMHVGEARRGSTGLRGMALHVAARVREAAHGAQILLSDAVRDIAEDSLPDLVTLRDCGEHRLRDVDDPVRLFQVCHPELTAEFPPLRSMDLPQSNLPLQITSFVGRSREIADVGTHLAQSRLVTLTGTGGSGKTRLALQVASELAEEVEDPVCFVDLSHLADPDLVPQTVASVLGVGAVSPAAGPADAGNQHRDLTEQVIDRLRERASLLVLDNCEHLIDGVAPLADRVLRACPGVKILTTSQQPLGLEGEVVWRIPPLELPDPDGEVAEAVAGCESVRLFVERARLARPDFATSEQNLPSIAETCRALDGLPLAIELAAARVNVLTPEQIRDRLSDRFSLLAGGPRTPLERHRTLLATVDWSYGLLSEEEQSVLRRAAVFSGSFDLESIEEVGSTEPAGRSRILDVVSNLVGRSLLVVEETETGARYRLLETLRQYALERMREAGEEEVLRDSHLAWFAARVLKLYEAMVNFYFDNPEGARLEQARWLERIEIDHDNLRAAMEWGLRRHPELSLQIASQIFRYWNVRGFLAEGRRWFELILPTTSKASVYLRSMGLVGMGLLCFTQGDYQEARNYLEASIPLARSADNSLVLSEALYTLALAREYLGDTGPARDLAEESVVVARRDGNQMFMSAALSTLGRITAIQGEYGPSRKLFEEALLAAHESGHTWRTVVTLRQLGELFFMQGDFDDARLRIEECKLLATAYGDRPSQAFAEWDLGWVALCRGEYRLARRYFEIALRLAEQGGLSAVKANSHIGLGLVAHAEGNSETARSQLDAGVALASKLGAPWVRAWFLGECGDVLRELGDLGAAGAALEDGLRAGRATSYRWGTALCLFGLAELRRETGDIEGARRIHEEALTLRAEEAIKPGIAESLEGLAHVAAAMEEPDRAARLLGAASSLRERMGYPVPPPRRALLDRTAGAARAALGDKFEAAWEAGVAMQWREAAGYAFGMPPEEAVEKFPRKIESAVVDPVASVDGEVGLRREGEYWTLSWAGGTARLRDSKGLQYLAILLRSPHREVPAVALARSVEGEAPGDAPSAAELAQAGLSVGDDTGEPVLDEHAKRAYAARLRDLEAEIEEAEGWNDPARAERAREELEALTAEISRATGLGGRDRRLGTPAERARVSVTKAIRSALERVARDAPDLASELGQSIRTGATCAFAPSPEHRRWRVS